MTDARAAALRRYARAYDRHAEAEQLAKGRGLVHLAEDYHQLALRVLRAFRAELDDPVPAERSR